MCQQDLSRLQQKIDSLERLLRDNNRLVAALRDSLLRRKASWETGGGANISSDSAHSRVEALPGCRLAEEKKDGTDGVQVSLAYATSRSDERTCSTVLALLKIFLQ